jgi:hypothetical protein
VSNITVCSVCGKARMESNTVEIDGRTVCAQCKPLFLQQLQEGALPTDDSTQPIEIPSSVLQLRGILLITWWVLRDRWLAILGLAILVAIPSEIILAQFPSGGETLKDVVRDSLLYSLIQILVGSVGTVAIIRLTAARINGRRMSLGQALQHGLSCWLPAIGTGILQAFIEGCFYLLLILPGVMWAVYYAFSICVVSLREESGMPALRYSQGLVQGRWWHTALTLLGVTLLSIVAVQGLGSIASLFPSSALARFVFAVLIDALLMTTTVCTTVLFLNLERVKTDQRPIPSSTEEG